MRWLIRREATGKIRGRCQQISSQQITRRVNKIANEKFLAKSIVRNRLSTASFATHVKIKWREKLGCYPDSRVLITNCVYMGAVRDRSIRKLENVFKSCCNLKSKRLQSLESLALVPLEKIM